MKMLALSFIALVFLFGSASSWASPEVIVIRSEKSVVYADQYRKIPLGTLSRGKILKVAENAVKIDSLYTITLSGRIAYVPAEDVYEPLDVEEEWSRRYYISRNLDEAYLYRRWVREDYLSFGVGTNELGPDIPGLAESQGGEGAPSQNSWPFQAALSWRMDPDYGWTVGAEYNYWSAGNWSMHTLTSLGALDLYLWDTHRTSLVWSNALVFSPYGRFNYRVADGAHDSGMWSWGAQTKLRFHWRWDRLWGPFLEGQYRFQRIQGLDDDFPGQSRIDGQGFGLFAGLFFAWD